MKKLFNLEESLNNCTTYIASLSSKTIVYKGMLLSTQVREFYPDLLDKDVESAISFSSFKDTQQIHFQAGKEHILIE